MLSHRQTFRMTFHQRMKLIRIRSFEKFIITYAKTFISSHIISIMNDGIILQTHFAPSSSETSALPPILSLPVVTKKKNKYLYQYGPYALVVVLLLVILIIVAVIISKVTSLSPIPIESTSIVPSSSSSSNGSKETTRLSSLVESMTLEDMFIHLRQFESRAIGTESFNRTIDYLISQLNRANSLTVKKYYFSVPRTELNGSPSMLALPNTSNASIFTYPRDFVTIDRSTEARNWSLRNGRPLSYVARFGCSLEDWNMTKEGDVTLVRRGNCTFTQKIFLAMIKRASACLIYNDGLTIDRLEPLNNTRAPRNNTIPALFLSYEAGMRLIFNNISRIYLRLEFRALPPTIVTNVCADTKFGDINRTIVVGSHSDSVAAGLILLSIVKII